MYEMQLNIIVTFRCGHLWVLGDLAPGICNWRQKMEETKEMTNLIIVKTIYILVKNNLFSVLDLENQPKDMF